MCLLFGGSNCFDMPLINPYYCALMFERVLPESVKPFKLARKNARLSGVVPLLAFENLASGMDASAAQAQVQVDVRFETGPGGVALLSGTLVASIPFLCQRCLETVSVTVNTSVQLAIFEQDIDEGALPEGYESIQVDAEQVRLVDLIEQEIILAAPLVPVHENCEWVAIPAQQEEIEEPTEVLPQKENPFAGLPELLAKSNQPRKK